MAKKKTKTTKKTTKLPSFSAPSPLEATKMASSGSGGSSTDLGVYAKVNVSNTRTK